MDLGFGAKNQFIGQALAKQIDKTAKAQEEEVIAEINKYDALLEANDSELEKIRERRLEQMKKAQAQREKYRSNGHGEYTDLCQGKHGDTAKEFFEATKVSDRMVVHFYRPSTRLCDVFHMHLQRLAERHLETKFCKINVEEVAEDGAAGSGASYLVDKLGIVVMPTLVIIKDRKAVHHIRGFDELGGSEDFSTDVLEWIIGCHQGIHMPEGKEMPDELANNNARRGVNGVTIKTKHTRGRRGGVREHVDEYDSDE
jgi:hypothetical protein